jgi:hypothetical protein
MSNHRRSASGKHEGLAGMHGDRPARTRETRPTGSAIHCPMAMNHPQTRGRIEQISLPRRRSAFDSLSL